MLNFNSMATAIKNPSKMKKADTDGCIEFLCSEEDYGVIAEPIPANKVLPDWYKNLEGKIGPGLGKSTVKRCMPFLDAMTMGWIIPLAAEVEAHYKREGKADFSWNFDKPIIATHDVAQIGGDSHPFGSRGVMKFNNYWAIKVPDGYSLLFTAPLNRVEPRFQPFSGVVDADKYFNFVNIPFVWTGDKFHGVLEKGTPIVQVIPFKRDGIIGDGTISQMTEEDADMVDKTKRLLDTEESNYRNKRWQAKNASRVINKD